MRILVVVLLLVGGAVAWWYFAPDTLPAFAKSWLPPAPNSAPNLYKWRDAKGALHVTDTPPADRPYEIVRYDPNANLLPKGVAPNK